MEIVATPNLLKIASYSSLINWSSSSLTGTYFNSEFPLTYLRKHFRRAKNAIIIEDEKTYKRITVRLYGKGVVLRDTLTGREIGTKRQFIAKKGQLIISRIDARNGAFGIVPEELEGAIVTNDFWLFDYENVSIDFFSILLSLEKFQPVWQSKSSGTTNRQRVDEQDFLNTKVPMPPVSVQSKMVTNYKNKLNQAESIESQANDLVESISVYLDTKLNIESESVSKSRFFSTISFQKLDRWSVTLKPNVNHSNSKFPVMTVDKLCKVSSGGTPSRSQPQYYTGDIPWVKTGEVCDNYIFDTSEKITNEAVENSSAKIYQKNSLIVAMYGHTRGKTAKLAIDAATNQACAVLHNINENVVLCDYLWIYLQNEYERLRSLAIGSAQPNLNALMIKSYPVILPGISIQKELVNTVFEIKHKIAEMRKYAQDLKLQANTEFETAIFGS